MEINLTTKITAMTQESDRQLHVAPRSSMTDWQRREVVSCDPDQMTGDRVAIGALVVTILVTVVVFGGILW